MQQLLTVSDVGRIANRTPETVRRAIAAGRLKVATRTPSGIRLIERGEAVRYAATLRALRRHEGPEAA